MLAIRILRGGIRLVLAMLACGLSHRAATANDFFFADAHAFPGQLWIGQAGIPPRLAHRRQPSANPAFPRAAMKLSQVAVGPEGNIYFCSGLDGYVLELLDGKHEILKFEADDQIRDLACSDEEHTVYFSVLPTPRDGAPLADGKIYRRDLWAGQPSEVVTVRQSQVGGNWWGTFAVKDGDVYLATLEHPSRVLKLTTAGVETVFGGWGFEIVGLTVGPDQRFYFTDGTANVYRTADFETVELVFRGIRPLTDVALQPAPAHPRP